LPTEFCIVDGVSDAQRKGPGMRDALAKTKINPSEKISKIDKMVCTLNE
jgi:hypothetical protein